MGLAEQAQESAAGTGVVSQRLRGAGSVEDVAAAAFDALLGRFGASRAGLALTVPGGRQLRFISSDATGAGEARWCLIDAYAELPLNDAVRTGCDVVLPTRESLMTAYPELGSKQQPATRSVLALALQQADRRVGGLVVYLDQEVDWPRLRAPLSAFAAEVCAAVVAARRGAGADDGPAEGYRLPADETAAGLARRFLQRTLGDWDVAEDVTYSALLCASEIVTNVIMHAACPSVISADRSPAGVTVEIKHPTAEDTGPPPGIAGAPRDPLDVAGRGLAIVAAVAAEWGTGRAGDLTRWWFRVG